jgi:hypothetical protein
MSVKQLSGWFAAAALASAVVSAQVPAQQPPQTPDQKQATADQKDAVKIAGCVQKESDVLKRSAMATNMGMSDEYVLTDSKLNPSSTTEPEPQAKPDEPTGTSGSADKFGKVVRLTGDKEKDLSKYVGQRVEITGAFKHESDANRTAGSQKANPTDPTSNNTPEITIETIAPTSGTCSPIAR